MSSHAQCLDFSAETVRKIEELIWKSEIRDPNSELAIYTWYINVLIIQSITCVLVWFGGNGIGLDKNLYQRLRPMYVINVPLNPKSAE